jgi:multimeric flavodoxin WrbA
MEKPRPWLGWHGISVEGTHKVKPMKKIIGIIASPRRLANCEIMIKEISKHVPESHALSLLRLSDFNIRPCKGCYLCLFKNRRCIQRDDYDQVLEAMTDAHGYIVAAPTYFLGANGSLKMLLDRGLAFYGRLNQLWGKPSVGIGIAGIEGKEGSTLLDIQRFLKLILSDIKQVSMIYSALPGEVLLHDRNIQTASQLGQALFGNGLKNPSPLCPQCGGDTFRFLGEKRIGCMLCSNTGYIQWEGETPVFSIEKQGSGLFLSKKEALEHEEWLRKQVREFAEKREQLNNLRAPFKEGWKWIKPK